MHLLGPYGALCATESSLSSQFTTTCSSLSACTEIDVVVSCNAFLVSSSIFKAVYLAILCVLLIPVFVGLYILRKRKLKKVLLNSELKKKQEESDLVHTLLGNKSKRAGPHVQE